MAVLQSPIEATEPAGAEQAARGPIRTAEILSIGSELTVGETRDTNAGDLARDLTDRGVKVGRLTALPDDLAVVSEAMSTALARSDLVVTTGGLGPTPDDLTREAIAAVFGQEPAVDPDLERWLRELWRRRSMPFPEMNLKQAWLIPGARSIPNDNGTAPGWWAEHPAGGLVVALPGPPREMRPMWRDWVLPRLTERGLGQRQVVRTLRLFGIGESQVADLVGEPLLRASNPTVATYARVEAVDVRIAAYDEPAGRTAADLVAAAEEAVRAVVGAHVWAHDDQTWADALDAELARQGWTLSTLEIGTAGALATLLGTMTALRRTEGRAVGGAGLSRTPAPAELLRLAADARAAAGADVGLVVVATERGADTTVRIGIDGPAGTRTERRLAFLGGHQGRARAALTGVAILREYLRDAP